MLNRIRRRFTPPAFPDDELKTLRAALLYIAILPTLGVSVANIIGNILGGQTPLITTLTNVLMVVVCLVSLWATRRQHLTGASVIMVVLGWFAITMAALSLGTIRTPTTTIYVLLVICSGMLLGWIGLIATIGLSSLTVAGLIVAENVGWLPTPNYAVTVTQWVTFTALFIMIGLLTFLALSTTRRALQQAQTELTERKKAEQSLRESEEKYRGLVQNSPDAIIIYQNGQIVFANTTCAQLLHASLGDELLGRSVIDFVHPDYRQFVVQRMTAVRQSGQPLALAEEKFIRLDGTAVEVEVIAIPFTFAEQPAVQLIARDITARKHAEQELRKLSRAVEQSPTTIVITTASGAIEYVNPRFTQTTGYTVAEALGQNPRILKSGETGAQEYKRMWETITSGGEWRGEFSNKKKNGEIYYETATIGPIWNERGEITNFVAVKEDITARKLAEQALREVESRLLLLGQNLEDTALFVHYHDQADNRPCFEYMNDSIEKITGVSAEDAMRDGMALLSNVWPEDAARLAALERQSQQALTSLEIEVRQRHAISGEMRWMLLRMTPRRRLDESTVWYGVQIDITERKRAEAALRESNGELQRRNEELDAYAHTVAHDLKNPLGVLVGYADLLLDNYGTLSDDITRQSLVNISRSGRKAGNIIDSLLVLASVRKQDVQAMPLDMGHIVDEVLVRLADSIRDSDADLHVPDRASWPIGLGYAPWVEEIWVNYLSNAVKYGGPRPRIELDAMPQPDGFIRFSVRDYGPGLTLEQQARLFAPFERLGQTRARGHGLGLSVVRRITDKLGGQAGVDSAPGQGSVFYFTLPAASL